MPLKLWRSMECVVAEQAFLDDLLAPYGFSMHGSRMAVLRADKVKDPHWIYPGEVLLISGTPEATPGTPADSVAPADTMAPPPAAPTDSAIPMPQQPPTYEPGAPRPMTIFNPARFEVVRAERQTITLDRPSTAVR